VAVSVAGVLRRGRTRHLDLLVDRCRAERVTGEAWDRATSSYTPTTAKLLPSGTRCRLKAPTTAAETAIAGEQAIIQRRYELDLEAPVALDVEDIVTIEVSDDSWVIGRPLTVVGIGFSGTTTARRIVVEDRTGASAPAETITP
jgi:hypothetical protein